MTRVKAAPSIIPMNGSGDRASLTIEQLSQATGVSTRNIRAHQARGVLPPPTVRGRTGYYSPDHVARLKLILDMQSNGYNLRTIARLLKTLPEGLAGELVDFERALRSAWDSEQPEIFDADDLVARFGVDPRGATTGGERARRLGLITPLPDGRFEVRSPALLHAGEALARLGIPLESLFKVQEELLRHAEGVASAFVRLFLKEVWKPFDEAGQPEERWPEVRGALNAMVPVAHEALAASFRVTMATEVESALERVLKKQAKRAR
jgi:DNA-binding transcriptional MerR regulator